MKKRTTALKLPSTMDGKVRKYLKVRHLINLLEPQAKALLEPIKEYLEKRDGRLAEFAGRILSLVPIRKFNAEAAEKVLGKKKLAPYWVTTETRTFDVAAAAEALGEETLAPFWEEYSTRINVK